MASNHIQIPHHPITPWLSDSTTLDLVFLEGKWKGRVIEIITNGNIRPSTLGRLTY